MALLSKGEVLDKIANFVWSATKELVKAKAATGEELNAKFSSEGGTFTLSYGIQSYCLDILDVLPLPPTCDVCPPIQVL